ncbi:MAG: hypothetical protein Q8J93_15080 [Xanthomonadales bacterium]|nr:hypothetical protein [Xanthomonadales bacterium]
MSTFNRNTLALALAAALLPASAFAFNVQTAANTTAEPIAQQVASPLTMSEQIQIFANSTQDNLQGRTTGFGVRLIILTPGVTIVGPFTTAVGPPVVGLSNGAALAGNWTASASPTIGLNTSNQSTASWAYSFAAGPGIQDGNIININALPLAIASPATNTSAIQARIELFDPNTNAVIVTAFSDLVSRPDGLVFACTAQASPARIDVAGGTNPFAFGAKTAFVPNSAAIGVGPASLTTPLGTLSVTASAGFNLLPGDLINSVITGTNLTNFTSFFLAAGPACAGPIAGATYTITGNVAKLGGGVTTTGTGVTNASLGFGPGGGTAQLCATVNGTGVIDAQSFAVSNGLNGVAENDPCTVASLQFNGSVVKVFTFNPAGNTTQESFARVTNWGTIGGKVTVQGWDDSNTPAASNISFTLPAGQSFQFNSTDLEDGNAGKGITGAFGNGAGKWRLVVTGEFDGMHVTSLNRNNTVGTLTNLTDSDNRGEQVSDGK